MASRASNRKHKITELKDSDDPLAVDYARAERSTFDALRMARDGGDYPLLSGGDTNLYALFTERAMTLTRPDGIVGLLTPIGIAADKTSAEFFSTLAKERRIQCFYSFQNRRGWLFPEIHFEEQPSIIVFTPSRGTNDKFEFCARVSSWEEFDDKERRFAIDSKAFVQINPNTGTSPLFRSRRDASLTTQIYSRLPVLVNRSSGRETKTWPLKYVTMFHMTNDSHMFSTREELEEKERAWPIRGNRFGSANGEWVPLYEGKSIQIFNHRYASIRVNSSSASGQGVAEPLTTKELRDPELLPEPRYWVNHANIPDLQIRWVIGFNDVCNTNNARTLVVSIVPPVAFGNKLPFFMPSEANVPKPIELVAANLGSTICDYVARQKVQSRNMNKYIIEQLPVVPPRRL